MSFVPSLYNSIQSAAGWNEGRSHEVTISVTMTLSLPAYAGHTGFSSPGVAQALLSQSSTPQVVDEEGALVPDGPAPAWDSELLIIDTPSMV